MARTLRQLNDEELLARVEARDDGPTEQEAAELIRRGIIYEPLASRPLRYMEGEPHARP